MKILQNGHIASPKGFKAAGVSASIKKSGKLDLALLFSEVAAHCAGVFTANRFAAAPVLYCKNILMKKKTVRAVVINSGNANSCTGPQGVIDADSMAACTGENLGLDKDDILVSSTGIIGAVLPMSKLYTGIKRAVAELSGDGGDKAALAIMTTDTVPKAVAVEIDIDGMPVTIAGMAKGSGMIAPQLTPGELHATMLAYITTDAVIDQGFFQNSLNRSVELSFNRISVDGDMSTNDTVIALANGAAGNQKVEADSPDANRFVEALDYVAMILAKMIVRDGEGATKFVELNICGTDTDDDSVMIAKAIANSMLCKTAWNGADPNWGRILDAIGYSGIEVELDNIEVYYDDIAAVIGGLDSGNSLDDQSKVLGKPEFKIDIRVGAGSGQATFWTCDLSHEYVSINADYHT